MTKSRARRHREKVEFYKRFIALVKHPMFWFLTIAGNAMIGLGSLALFYLEAAGEKPLQFVDCLLWSTSIVTTIGYSSYVPQTFFGKITVMGLMLIGTLFLWSYMAFLVSALISPALSSLEREVQDVEKELSNLKTEEHKTLKKEFA